ncbi:MAG: ribosome rescue protein RqcH [Candidatus Bathyarchaeia archaeon]
MYELSSFDLAALTVELNKIIKGSRINKIYQLNKTLLIKLRGQDENFNLLIEAGRRIHLTFHEIERTRTPPSFCMALRKYLENGVIEEIVQHNLERIVEIYVKRGGQEYRLIVELFEKGNVILIGPENKILHALFYRKMRDRNILRGEEYKYPPQRGIDPEKADLEDLYRLRDLGEIEVVRGVTRLLGISGSYAEEILFRAGIDKTKPCSSLSEEEIKIIFDNMRSLLHEVRSGDYRPCIIIDEEGRWISVAPFPLKKYSVFSILEVETFNKALDEYYMKVIHEERVRQVEERASQEISRLEKVLEEQRRRLEDLMEKARFYRRVGDIIYRHLHDLNPLIERIMFEKKEGRDWKDIAAELYKEKERNVTPSVYFMSLDPSTLTLRVSVDGEIFDLSLRTPAQLCAAEYYERAKKLEDKIEGLRKAIEETIKKIEDVKSEALREVEEEQPKLARKKEWYEKFRWFYSSEDFLVISGKDASTNETIIRKYMEKHDIVFHADIPGSPFTIIKTGGRQPGEETMFEAAQFTASYSRAWREQIKAVDVYWVKPEQVSKAPPSGQYLSKGSFMIYGDRNYIRNVPLEVAIGIKRNNGEAKVIGGPVSAISKQTNIYVRIGPGNVQSGRLAKEIRERLASMVSEKERKIILKIPLEDIQVFIPLGGGSII